MPTSRPVAESLVSKLQGFHETLPPPEQSALEDLLRTLAVTLSSQTAQLLASREMENLNELLASARVGPDHTIAVGPTVTTVTITTTIASHPSIGCS